MTLRAGLLAAPLLAAMPAGAQQSVLVVPEGAVVAVPARGAVAPARPATLRPRRARLPPRF
ncbi:hypothetical protein, partial [Paracraurococcus ruber]